MSTPHERTDRCQPSWPIRCLPAFVRRRLNDEHPGQALIMVSLMIFVLIGFAALATDTGMIWMNRRALQNSVDAAALAGVQELPEDAGLAIGVGCDYATDKNAVPSMTGKLGTCSSLADVEILQTYYPNDTIRVTAYKTINPIFGVAVGFGSVEIGASATAVVGSIFQLCGVPLFQTQDLLEAGGVWGESGVILNKPTIMKTSDSASGNFLALQVDGSSSASDWRDALGNPEHCLGEDAPVYGDTATTNPGNMDGPFDKGMKDRKAAWEAQGNCLSMFASDYLREDGNLWKYPLGTAGNFQLGPETCYRIVVIPILEGVLAEDFNGSKEKKIQGFAIFYIANWCGQSSSPKVQSGTCPAPPPNPEGVALGQMSRSELWGYYVSFVAVSDYYMPYNALGTKVYVLTD
jgi:hypothetical protein